MAVAKYRFNVTPEGWLRVYRSDGYPVSKDEAKWFQSVITNAIRGEALLATHTHDRRAELEEIAAVRASGSVDPLVLELEDERILHNLSRSQVASMAGSKTTRISDYTRGKAEPKIPTLKPWGAVLGMKLMFIPFELLPKVSKMVSDWRDERQNKIKNLRMEEG